MEQTISELLTRLGRFGTATIHEAQGQMGAMAPELKPIDPRKKLIGPALTVDARPGDNLALHVAIAHARPGDVLVVDAKGFTGAGLWGDIMTAGAQWAGIAGLVVDGAARDAESIIAAGFPVFCRGLSIRGTSKVQPGSVNVPISCGGVVVNPGDVVVGDRDGVVVVPAPRLAEVVRLSQEREDAEAVLRRRLAEGHTTVQLFHLENASERIRIVPSRENE